MNAILQFLAAHPGRAFTTAEVKAAVPEHNPDGVACYLAQSVTRGILARTEVPCPQRGTRVAFRFVRPPMPRGEIMRVAQAARAITREEAERRRIASRQLSRENERRRREDERARVTSRLQAPTPGPWGPLLGLFLANPGAWIASSAAAHLSSQPARQVGPVLTRYARLGLLHQRGRRKAFRWQLAPDGALAVWAAGGPPADLRTVKALRDAARQDRVARRTEERQRQEAEREAERARRKAERQRPQQTQGIDRSPRPLAPADPSLHPSPVIALLLSNPGAWVDRYDAGELGASLAALAYKGLTERRKGPRGHTEYRLLRMPHVRAGRPTLEVSMNRPARIRVTNALQPPVAGDYHPVVALLLANRGRWVRRRDVMHALPGEAAGAAQLLGALVKRGDIERRGLEYRAPEGWTPPTRAERRQELGRQVGRRNRARSAERRPAEPTPAQLADRQRRAEQKALRAASEAQAREERRFAREQDRLAAAERKAQAEREQDRITQQIRREDGEAVRAFLARTPEQGWSKGAIAQALGISVGRVTTALQGLSTQGLIMGGAVDGTYRLLDPGLPEVPATLTPLACRVREAMAGRAGETELGLVRLLGITREEVRGGLAALRACGRLTWTGVNNLVVYRLEPETEVRHVAA